LSPLPGGFFPCTSILSSPKENGAIVSN
jgi:hypothetical protein